MGSSYRTWDGPSCCRTQGVVGCSGGGMLTAYLAAVDERVQAASIACYFSTQTAELASGSCNYDAEQILWRQATLNVDKPDLLVSRAPKPTQVPTSSTTCFSCDGNPQQHVGGGDMDGSV
eukprot:5827509-Amphidinium_carterae.1